MTKAMGLNTVCAYLFWNMHEPRPGTFVWTGQADAAAIVGLVRALAAHVGDAAQATVTACGSIA